MKSTQEISNERKTQHGAFKDNAHAAQGFKALSAEFPNHRKLTEVQREGLDMIFVKIGRILSGNPDWIEHWADVAGFAELVVQDLRGGGVSEEGLLVLHEDCERTPGFKRVSASRKERKRKRILNENRSHGDDNPLPLLKKSMES